MSDTFDLTENTKFDKEIIYDYPLTTIYSNEITDNNNAFQAPVTYSIDNNFYYTSDGKTSEFNFTKIHIGKLYHDNIVNVSENNSNIVGEVVLEHSNKCYTCFFLETSNSATKNTLEAILAGESANYELTLNNIIPKQEKCIQYKDGSKQIFVFTTPIYMTSDLKEVLPDISYLFSKKYDKNYSVIPGNNINQRDDDQIYIDCSPTGASEEELNTYNVPINSRMLNEKQQTDLMLMTTNFAFFAVLSLAGYFLVPMFYKKAVIDMILFMKPGTGKEVNIDRLKTIASADITIMLIFAAVIMLFYTLGMTQDPKFTSLSLMLSLVAILSASLITMKKSSSEFLRAVDSNGRVIQLEVPMTTITDEVTKKKTEIPVGISTSLGGVGQFIGDSLGFLLKLLPAIIAIMLVGSIVPGILMSFGILPKDITALISGGGIMFATVGLIAFKLIEKVEKLKRGEEV
jgi:hypothetical protein